MASSSAADADAKLIPLPAGRVIVCTRMGDPIIQPARARSIWAAQTAQATYDLGIPTMLVGASGTLPVSVTSPETMRACRRLVGSLYNVGADYDIGVLYPSPLPAPERPAEPGTWELDYELPRYVLPGAALVHTRDPRVVRKCATLKIPVIYEDHNEDYHEAVGDIRRFRLDDPACRLIVAITEKVRERLVGLGVDPARVRAFDSGVNPRAAVRNPARAESWRRFLLGTRYTALCVYTGGMQVERGIDHILFAAQQIPEALFAFAGGTDADVARWRAIAAERNIRNVRIYGYVDQHVAIELQQAADVAVMSRRPGERSEITSPLKFFEYLATGAAVVAAHIPSLPIDDLEGLTITWYSPMRPHTIVDAIRRSIAEHPYTPSGFPANSAFSRRYQWPIRQRAILNAAGFRVPRRADAA